MYELKRLANRIDEVLATLADYDRINIDEFYNDSNNTELLNSLDTVLKGVAITKKDAINVVDLYNELDSFIQFETEYNGDITHF